MRPKVRIRLAGALRDQVGYGSVEVEIADRATLHEAIRLADREYGGNLASYITDPDTGDFPAFIVIFVNREEVRHLQGPSTPLADGAEIIIFRTDMVGG